MRLTEFPTPSIPVKPWRSSVKVVPANLLARFRSCGSFLIRPDASREGEILFAGRDIMRLTDAEMREVRGGDIGMVFQEPMTSLNPVLTIGRQITETLEQHRGDGSRRRRAGGRSNCWAWSASPTRHGD